MVPGWLEGFSIAFVVLSIACALIVVGDLFGRPQKMWIMDLVWPLTVLYSGPFGLWAYYVIGRTSARRPMDGRSGQGRHTDGHGKPRKPFWQAVFTGSTHCGAGCAVGDFIGEWLVFSIGGFTLLGSTLFGKYVVAYVLAYLFGVVFQYFSIAPMRGLGLWDGLRAAIRADTLSLTAYEVGMFAWMAVTQKLPLPGIEPTTWTFWFMMQIAMMLGLATTFPMNWWLLKRGIKEAM